MRKNAIKVYPSSIFRRMYVRIMNTETFASHESTKFKTQMKFHFMFVHCSIYVASLSVGDGESE